tara:strand:+ start:146 stop:625 length:480 start_codon:yes stop_codon:yes gene_type:complete
MATAAQVIKAALQRIVVQASEADLEPDEYSDAIFAMNNLMLGYDADDIKLGYTLVTSIGDAVTIPVGALRGLIANLAIEIAPDYDGQISPALSRAAKEGYNTMQTLGVTIVETAFPATLPIGSGNTHTPSWDDAFYNEQEASILGETTGAIALESNIQT